MSLFYTLFYCFMFLGKLLLNSLFLLHFIIIIYYFGGKLGRDLNNTTSVSKNKMNKIK